MGQNFIMKPIEEVTMLYEITKALNAHLILKKSLYKVLDILSSSMNMVRGTITILNPMRNEISIEVAHGLTRNAMERVKYKLGEGITGRVIETGEAVSIPKISEEPLFLDDISRQLEQNLPMGLKIISNQEINISEKALSTQIKFSDSRFIYWMRIFHER